MLTGRGNWIGRIGNAGKRAAAWRPRAWNRNKSATDEDASLFCEDWYRQTYLNADWIGSPRKHFAANWRDGGARPNPLFDPCFVQREAATAFGGDPSAYLQKRTPEIDATCEWFSRRQYLSLHPDVATGWTGPAEIHFLQHGLVEGRRPHPDFLVQPASHRMRPGNRFRRIVYEFQWHGREYDVVRSTIPATIIDQIHDQGRHEIALFAPGDRAIATLPQVPATDLEARANLDIDALLTCAGDVCETAIFVPGIQIGGGDRFVAELARELRGQFGTAILVIVSEWSETETRRRAKYKFLSPLFESRLLFWRDVSRDPTQDAWHAALLMNRLRPRRIIVANSDLGFSMLARYGTAISSFAQCLPIFFSESPNAMGAPYSARYFVDICRMSCTVTDNERMARTLRHRAPSLPEKAVFVLPPTVDVESERVFDERINRRFRKPAAWKNQSIWIARVEPFKGTDILLAVAAARRDIIFNIFGPASVTMRALLNAHRNVRYRGQFLAMKDIDFEQYEFLIFPSLFEGMPNTVLEAVQVGLPVVSSNVGGLKETFDDRHASFVELSADIDETAERFVAAIDALQSMPAMELEARIRAAREALLARHGKAAFAQHVRRLLSAA